VKKLVYCLFAVSLGAVVGCRSQGNGMVALGQVNINLTAPKNGRTLSKTDGTNEVDATSGSAAFMSNSQKANGNDEGNSPSIPVSLTK